MKINRQAFKLEPPVLIAWLLLDITGCTAKILGAFYSGSLLLAGDALFGLAVWYYFLSSSEQSRKIHAAVAIPLGLVLASAALGITWQALGVLLADSRNLLTRGPGATALLTAAAVFAAKYGAGYLISMVLGLKKALHDGEELLFEQGVSRMVLTALVCGLLFGSISAVLDAFLAVLAAAAVAVLSVSVIYSYTSALFEKISGEEHHDS